MMERYSSACRFILSCNYSSRIIDPIQSRCAVFRSWRSRPPRSGRSWSGSPRGRGSESDPDAYEAIIVASAGDLRRAINILQLTATFANPVTLETVRRCTTTPLRDEIEEMLELALRPNFLEARDRLYRLFTERGASGEDILRAIHAYVPESAGLGRYARAEGGDRRVPRRGRFPSRDGRLRTTSDGDDPSEDRRPTGGSEVKGWPGNVP